MASEENQREFTRVPVHIQVEVAVGDVMVKAEKTHDISMKGVLVDCKETFEVGKECTVSLVLAGDEQPIRVVVKGKIERSNDDGLGIEFTEIGLDSYEHLQNLVRFNSHDSGLVEKEIKDHLGLKKR